MQFPLFLLLCAVSLGMAKPIARCPPTDNDVELLWDYEIRRPYGGDYQRIMVEEDYGPTNATITCVRFFSLSEEDNHAAMVIQGGVGYNFVKVKFLSNYGRGLHYRVLAFGERGERKEDPSPRIL